MKDVRESWDSHWNSNRFWSSLLTHTPTYRKLSKMFKKMGLSRDARILDAGCGSGKLCNIWAQEGYDILGVDISDVALRLTNNKGIGVIKADIRNLPFKDDTFDLVYTDGLLEHFINPEPFLAEIFRASKNYVFTLVPRKTWLDPLLIVIFNVVQMYYKKDFEWIELHQKFKPASLKTEDVYTQLSILCKKQKTTNLEG